MANRPSDSTPFDATLPPRSENDATLPPVVSNVVTGTADADADQSRALSIPGNLPNLPNLPGYEILGELGRGGMGVVYKARHLKLNRVVALKMVLSGEHASQGDMVRFLAEAQAVAGMQHPNIVQLFESGQFNGLPYFTLEFVAGGSLAGQIREHPLAPMESARLVEQLARGVAYAHDRGIVHRDLKPENVLLSVSSSETVNERRASDSDLGTPKITDFGLAKRVDGDSGLTRTGAVMGTPSYMAPEQAEGKKEVGPLADVYALGAILYRLVVGRPPFQAATPLDTIMQVVTQEPVPPRQLNPKVPRDVETIILKCLHKDPARRYGSATHLADDLKRFIDGEAILARPVGRVERTIRWCRKYPAVAALFALSIAFGVVMLALFAHARNLSKKEAEARESTEQALGRERDALGEVQKSKLIVEDQKQSALAQLYATRVDLAYREWRDNNVYRAEQLLNDCPAEMRGWEWNYLKGLCRTAKIVFRGSLVASFSTSFSPDGTMVLSATEQSGSKLWDAHTGRELQSFAGGHPSAFSPDGTRIIVTAANGFRVHDASSGRELFSCVVPTGTPVAVSFSDDGKKITTVSANGTVEFWDGIKGEKSGEAPAKLALNEANRFENLRPRFSPDGKLIAAGGSQPIVRVWEAATGKLLHDFKGHVMHVTMTAFTPDGALLASAGADGTIFLWDLKAKKELRRLTDHTSSIESLAISTDGKRLASGSRDMSIRIWDLNTFETETILRGHNDDVVSLAFRADGKELVSSSGDRTTRIWDISSRNVVGPNVRLRENLSGMKRLMPPGNQSVVTYYGHNSPTPAFTFSSDGRFAATASADSFVIVWDLMSRSVALTIRTDINGIGTPQFHPTKPLLAIAFAPFNAGRKGTVDLWDMSKKTRVWRTPGPECTSAVLDFHPDGERFTAAFSRANGGEVRTYSVADGAVAGEPVAVRSAVHSFRYSLDGEKMVFASMNTIAIIDAKDKKLIRNVFHGSSHAAFAVSKDGILATAGNDLLIKLHDLNTGQFIRDLEGHVGWITTLAFSPDGKRLVSAGNDTTVKVWDVADGRELITFRDHRHKVYQVGWSGDGRSIGAICHDGSFKVWSSTWDTPPTADDWPVLFRDTFDNRAALGPKWHEQPNWSIENGALRGKLVEIVAPAGGVLPMAILSPKELELPSTVDIRFDCWTPQPLLLGVTLDDSRTGRSLTPFLSGTDVPMGKGASVLMMREHSRNGERVGVPTKFNLEPNRKYSIRVLREPQRITLFVDGRDILSEAVPEFEAPNLRLQGSWSKAGDLVFFDNLEVRAPARAIRERTLRTQAEAIFDRMMLREVAAERIKADTSLSEADRTFSLEVVAQLPEDLNKIGKTAWTAVRRSDPTPEEAALTLRQVESVRRSDGGYLPVLLVHGLAQFRAGKYAEAIQTLTTYGERQRLEIGTTVPMALAGIAMSYHKLGKPAEARATYQSLSDMMMGDGWSAVPEAREFFRETTELLKPVEDAGWKERDAIVSTLKLEQVGWQKHDFTTYMSRYADSVTAITARGEVAGPYDVRLDRQHMESQRRVQFRGTTNPDMKMSYENVRVTINGDEAEMRLLATVQSPGYFKTFEAIERFRRTPQGWKVTAVRSWPVVERAGAKLTRFDAAYWKAKDEAVEKARIANNRRELAAALIAAERIAEVDALLKAMVQEGDAKADTWRMRGVAASDLGNGDEARKAFRRAAELDPEMVLPWHESGQVAAMRVASTEVHGVDVDPSGEWIATAAGSNVRLWDIAKQTEIRSFVGHQHKVSGLAFSPDGTKLATGGADSLIKIWETATGRELFTLRGHANTVYRLAWTRDGKKLVSASGDASVGVWNAESGQLLHKMLGHTNTVYGLALSPDNRFVVSASADLTLILFNIETGRAIGRVDGDNAGLSSVAYSPDGSRVAVGGTLKLVNVFDLKTHKRIMSLRGHTGAVDSVLYSRDGRFLFSTSNDGTTRIWNAADGKLVRVLRGHQGPVHSFAISADGKRLVSGGTDGTVRIWELQPVN